ncbi:MAG: PHP-associated domain-containing protein [Anaerovoracaceae bacterium]
MKLDLHTHTKEGSIDSRARLVDYIRILKSKGIDGMLLTDHNSYKAHLAWKAIKYLPEFRDFVVLKGIEYDTKGAGHYIIVLPDHFHLPFMKMRGLSLKRIIHSVHHYGGIIGPAHPYGVASSSAMHFRKIKANPKIIKEWDFIEVFNVCESKESNIAAQKLAEKYKLPGTAGSDAHDKRYIGMSYTEFDCDIKNNKDLISAILNSKRILNKYFSKAADSIEFSNKGGHIIFAGGTEREPTKRSAAKDSKSGIYAYKALHSTISSLIAPFRKYKFNKNMK